MMIKIVALMGKAGAGKDWVLNRLLHTERANRWYSKVVNCTTRPIRENEVDGVNYHYLTHEEFTEKLLSGDLLETTEFNNWFYGTLLSTLSEDKINIGVFNPEAVEILKEDKRINLMVIYIEATDKIRLLRQLNREDNPDCHEIARRFLADEQDFEDERINEIQPAFGILNEGKTELEIQTMIDIIEQGIARFFYPKAKVN